MFVSVMNNQVIEDTHGVMGTLEIPATKIAKKIYPEAKEKDGSLLVPVKCSDNMCFTVPETGHYSIMTEVHRSGNGHSYHEIHYMKKGDQKHFGTDTNVYISRIK